MNVFTSGLCGCNEKLPREKESTNFLLSFNVQANLSSALNISDLCYFTSNEINKLTHFIMKLLLNCLFIHSNGGLTHSLFGTS